MKIGVDAREIQDGVVTGIGRPLANFIEYFGRNVKEHTLVLFSEKTIPVDFHENISCVVIKPISTFLWDQWQLTKALKANRIDIFYSPYYKIPLAARVPMVNQVLDLMYLVFPPYRKNLSLWRRCYYFTFGRAFARKAVSIITDSQHAKSDIVRLWRIDAEKIVVIPLGLASRYVPVQDAELLSATRKNLCLPEKYILYLGNFKPHKNVKSLVHAFKRIAGQFPDYKLVLAGPLDSHGGRIQSLVSTEWMSDKVVFTDTIRERDCPEALMSMADLFVFPSFYEGFGLPPLEAMACGTPVVASNVTAVPEVIGDAGVMVDPTNVEELSQAIAGLLTDAKKREEYSQKGLGRAKLFREEETAGSVCRHILNMLGRTV